jgi:hypothetical protein
MAWARGETGDEATVGALLVANGLSSLRDLAAFVRGFARSAGR